MSDKPEGSLGGTDIYKVEIEGKNPPVNLGPAINTPYGEEGVFMAPDGKTLYFSSEGHNTMGGYDIFKIGAGKRPAGASPKTWAGPSTRPTTTCFL